MANDMKRFITIVETAEFDYDRRAKPMKSAPPFDGFSKRGASYRIKRNDPRYGDNPLADDAALDEADIREAVASPQLIRLHKELNKVVSDEEIKAGLSLAQSGLHKLAAILGVGPEDVHVLLSSLTQNLRDDEAAVEEAYHAYMEAADKQDPFADEPDEGSIERDALGSDTVRSASTGKSKFVQGSAATSLEKKLAQPNADQQAVLRTLMTEDAGGASFDSAIKADTGSYNFPWKLAGRHGFATAFFRRDTVVPKVKITSISDADGNDLVLPSADRRALVKQALEFIGDA